MNLKNDYVFRKALKALMEEIRKKNECSENQFMLKNYSHTLSYYREPIHNFMFDFDNRKLYQVIIHEKNDNMKNITVNLIVGDEA